MLVHATSRCSRKRQTSYPYSTLHLPHNGWHRTSATGMFSAHECSPSEPLKTLCLCTPIEMVLTSSRLSKQCAAVRTQLLVKSDAPQLPELLWDILLP